MRTGGPAVVSRGRAGAGCVVIFAAISIVAAGAGCSSGPSASAGARVVVTERDFGLQASASSVRAGAVTVHVVNRGPSTHELNIDRTSMADGSLPLKPDGLTVNEDSPALQRVDSVNVVRLGSSQDLHLRLEPGHYVLYCNLEGHYLGTMHTSLEVTA
jgi:uncharacterized cupredoxin-like copper-binding protein